MADVRQAIAEDRFDEFQRTDPRCRLGPSDLSMPVKVNETTGESL
jgi:hypothetical protein